MLRVVIDTNILVSALLSKKGAPAKLVDAWRNREFLVISSESAILEVERVIAELASTGKYSISNEDIQAISNLLREDALLVSGQMDAQGTVPQDPDDEKFIAIALEGEATVIVSGDHHLLDLGKHGNISIQTARQFLDSLHTEPSA
ncbi:MAG: putative toxin-antitoxin system toxin component, PIN family [Anaerolineaceae bacterium]|nr:putative toxin-antitoxin system toxin component, PIN family [Anaerolineaceae bacterium]